MDPIRDLLRTKITPPPYRAGLISRPRLVTGLNAGLDQGARLILISAPAGSGKSTLASEWVTHCCGETGAPAQAQAVRFAWLAIDPSDNHSRQFWLYLIGALQAALPGLGQPEQRLLSFPQPPPVESILTGLLNQIEVLAQRVVLILDDYHLINEPSIHAGMAFILEHMPANLQLVLVTRADPPLPLSRLRVRNQLLEIRAADLNFTAPESEALINQVMGLGLSAADLAVLEERTEGWAAGIQLASVLLKDERRKAAGGEIQAHLSALVARLSGRQHLIADYLLDEVLGRQSPQVQRFLLESSVLDELCAPLCDALKGTGAERPDSQAILEYLESDNLFIIPLDEEHTWFRYHHLFADALRIRLDRTQPGAAKGLHLRASQWYEEHGQAEKAIDHALVAQDFDRAASLIERYAYDFSRQGRFSALLHWLEQIPAQAMLAHPRSGILNGQMLALSGKLSAAEQQLQAIETAAAHASGPAAASLSPELRGKIAAVRATAAILNADPVTAKAQAQLAIDLLPGEDSSLAPVMLAFGNAALMFNDIPLAIHWLRESIVRARQKDDLSTQLMALAHLSVALRMQGKLHQSETVCREALEAVDSQLGAGDWPLPTLAMIYHRLGNIRLDWYDLPEAEQALTQALRIAENSNYLSAIVNAYGGLSGLCCSRREYTQAIELIEKGIQAIHRQESSLYLDLCQALRAEYWVRAGNLAAARGWAEERHLTAERAIDYTGESELCTLVLLWIAEGRGDEAEGVASRLVAAAEASQQSGRAITCLVLQAMARQSTGKVDLAAQSLEQALSLAEPEGILRPFLDEGEQLRGLLQRITRKKSKAAAFARLLLSKLSQAGLPAASPAPLATPQTPLVEPLTDRELAVLRQMATGSSNQEIARRLVISEGTVKAHIYHITAKLGARSRTEAVARAREAGLLP